MSKIVQLKDKDQNKIFPVGQAANYSVPGWFCWVLNDKTAAFNNTAQTVISPMLNKYTFTPSNHGTGWKITGDNVKNIKAIRYILNWQKTASGEIYRNYRFPVNTYVRLFTYFGDGEINTNTSIDDDRYLYLRGRTGSTAALASSIEMDMTFLKDRTVIGSGKVSWAGELRSATFTFDQTRPSEDEINLPYLSSGQNIEGYQYYHFMIEILEEESTNPTVS